MNTPVENSMNQAASESPDRDELLEQFERAWRCRQTPQIAAFVNPSMPQAGRCSLIIDLVELDYEYRWRRFGINDWPIHQAADTADILPEFPTFTDYATCFEELTADETVIERLLRLEYRIRQRWADKPTIRSILERNSEYVSEQLFEKLAQIDVATAVDGGDSVTAPGHRSAQIGHYKLLQKIAEGGMGAVYMAEQQEPIRRRVALKMIKAGANPQQIIARFEAERQALAMMNHPNIAPIFDGGATENGSPYFVMELVAGIPMTEYCDRNRLSVRERLELFVPVCKAVQHAHMKGIVHRDLKPSNVLVALHDGVPVPKVIDFGLAKATELRTELTDKTMFTEFGQVVGTLQYMSPEQAEMNQLDVDTRTDIYSLGAMLYELLTGSTPLDRETLGRNALMKVLEMIREQEPPRPSTRLSESGDGARGVSDQRSIEPSHLQKILYGELDWIVMKSLEKDRTRRYETPNAFADDLVRYLNDEQVLARPPSLVYRLQKTFRRHKALILTLTLVFALLTAGLAGTGTMWIKAENETVRANEQTTLARSESKRAAKEAQRARAAEEEQRLARIEVENERDNVAKERDRAKAAESKADAESKKAHEAEVKERLARIEAEKERDNTEKERQKVAEAKQETEATLSRTNYLLANARWDANNAADANEFLDRVAPEHRKLEWYLAKRKFKGSDFVCYGHTAAVTDVDCNPAGTKIVSAGRDGTVRVWDAITGEQRKLLAQQTSTYWTSVRFSRDGSLLAAGNAQGKIHIWDAKTDKPLRKVHVNARVNEIDFSQDGQFIACGYSSVPGIIATLLSWKGGARLWRVESGEPAGKVISQGQDVTAIAISPDSSLVATGDAAGKLKLWDIGSGDVVHEYSGHSDEVTSVCFSPDGTRLVSGSKQESYLEMDLGSACIWEVPSDSHLSQPDTVGKDRKALSSSYSIKLDTIGRDVTSVSVSPDGLLVATGESDGNIRIWDLRSGELIATRPGHTQRIGRVRFTPGGARILSSSADKTLRLSDTRSTPGQWTSTFELEDVDDLQLSDDGMLAAAVNQGRNVEIWSLRSGSRIVTLPEKSDVHGVAFSHSGEQIALAFATEAKIFSVSNGALKTEMMHAEMACESRDAIEFSPDDRHLYIVGDDGEVRVWDAQSGDCLRTIQTSNESPDSLFIVNDDETRMTIGSLDALSVWDLPSGQSVRKFDTKEVAMSAELSPNGHRLAAGVMQIVRVWDMESGLELWSDSSHQTVISKVTYTPDGTRIVTGSVDGTVRVWDAETGEKIAVFEERSELLYDIKVTGEGIFVVRESTDWKCCVTVLSYTRRHEVSTLRGHAGKIEGFSFHENEQLLRTVSGLESLVWDVSTNNPTLVTNSPSSGWTQRTSADGRWLAIPDGNKVRLIDQTFKKHPAERAYCQLKGKHDGAWHRHRAEHAEQSENWFAATFHRAWEVQITPESEAAHRALRAAFRALDSDQKGIVPPVVRDSLEAAGVKLEKS